MGKTRPYHEEVSIEQARKLIHKHKLKMATNTIGCWLATTGSANTDGYRQVWFVPDRTGGTGRSSQKSYLLHRLATVAQGILPTDITHHLSHLCDHRDCFNTAHLVFETAEANNSRKGCPGDIVCPCPCEVLAYACPHMPKCIRE